MGYDTNINIINPDYFFNEWKKVLKSEFDKDPNGFMDKYHKNTSWTKVVKPMTESLLGGNNISREYYRIDTLKYEYTKLYQDSESDNFKHKFSNNTYLIHLLLKL